MKTRSLGAGAVRALLVLAAVAVLAACAPPLDNSSEGNLRIVLAGRASSGARAAIDPPEDVSYYLLEFSGPDGEPFPEQRLDATTENLTLTLTLSLGQWTVRAQAFTAEGELRGSGEAPPVTVEAGRINEAAITMKVATLLLAGTVTVVKPESLVLTGITVTAYKEAERITDIGTTEVSSSDAWTMDFPVARLAGSGTAWLRVAATDGTNSYTVDPETSITIPEGGIQDIALSLTIYQITTDPAIVGGSVAADKSYGTAGSAISLTVTPDPNYVLKSETLQYNDGTDHAIPGNVFAMPASDVTISAFFNRVLGFTVAGPADQVIAVTAEHSAGAEPATNISWSAAESVTLTLESLDYRAEDGNLQWIANGTKISTASGNSLVIRARDYVQRSYTVTVMIKEDGQWYSTEIPFEVTE